MDYLIRRLPAALASATTGVFSPASLPRVVEVAVGNGLKVFDERLRPHPSSLLAVWHLGAGGGVMITASHNPPVYNGFKIKEAFGGSARPSTTRVVEEIVVANTANKRQVLDVPFADALANGQVELFEAKTAYYGQLARYVDLELIRRAAIPVAADPMSGAGALLP
jgi:phosphomannomutase